MRSVGTKLVILAAILAGLLLSVPRGWAQEGTPSPTPDLRFGAIESFWAPEEAAELNVGWERILFYWNEIQPTGPDDWNTLHVLEEWLVEANGHGRIVLGLLKNTPTWATDGEPFSGVPRGLYLPVDDPDNLWANYVRRVAEYYAARGVHNWIVWNEPEIDKDVYGHEFSGTTEDYYRLLKVAYLVAKETDPQATIHLAGWSYWHDPNFLREFLEVATADPEGAEYGYFFDVLSLHIYFRSETVDELVREVDAVQNEFGLDKPIWINETNASPNLDPWWPVERPRFQVDLDQQAWYIVQAYALGFGAGADSISVYKLIDILLPEGGESFGILRPNYEKRPGFLAYRTTIERLRGFEGEPITQSFRNYYIVTFDTPAGVTRVLWARNPLAVTVQVPALGETAVLFDYLGNEAPIRAEGGAYAITLDGARCRDACEIGGPPVFLVEPGTTLQGTPPTPAATSVAATLTATPEVTLTFTPWPTPTPSPTPTATVTPTATPTQTPLPSVTPTITPQATATAVATGTVEATQTAVATPALSSGGVQSAWLFLGAGGVLAVLLALAMVRRGR